MIQPLLQPAPIQDELHRTLFEQTRYSMLAALGISVLLFILLQGKGVSAIPLTAWFMYQCFVSLARGALSELCLRQKSHMNRRQIEITNIVLCVLSSFGWAIIGMSLDGSWSFPLSFAVIITYIGVAAVGAFGNAASFYSVLGLVIPMATVGVSTVFSVNTFAHNVIGWSMLAYFCVLIGQSWRSHLQLVESFSLRIANETLIQNLSNRNDDLKREALKNQLALRKLRDSDKQQRALVNSAPEALLVIDLQSQLIVNANPAASILLCIEPDKIINADPAVCLLEGRSNMPLSLESFLGSDGAVDGRVITSEVLLRRHDGGGVVCELRLVRLPSRDQQLLRVSLIDITQRKRFERRLRDSELRYRTLFDGNPSVCLTVSSTGRIIDVNKFGASILGYQSGHLLEKQRLTRLLLESDAEESTRRIRECRLDPGSVQRWEHEVVGADGRQLYVRETMRSIGTDISSEHLLIVWEDITETHELYSQISWQANHDPLTGLLNRQAFEQKLKLLVAGEYGEAIHTLCFLDLDQFKVVNDTCGHLAGDELLRQISQQLSCGLRSQDLLARIGGDEFAVVLLECEGREALEISERMREKVEQFRFQWQTNSFSVGVSIGLVAFDSINWGLERLMSSADSACYLAKDSGRNRIVVFSEKDELSQRRFGEMRWAITLPQALEAGRFSLVAQPILPLNPGQGIRCEVLVRMLGEDGTLIPPGAFMSALERYNAVNQLDRWVVKESIRWLSESAEDLHELESVSINISGQSVTDERFLEFLSETVCNSRLEPSRICFEITETSAIANLTRATEFMKAMHDVGCRFALDDFGSGLSSFGYLRNLAVDYLKIDGQFVRDMANDAIDYAMVKSINDICKIMNKATVAESVESAPIVALLREIGMDYVQGYHVCRPMPLDEFLLYLKRGDARNRVLSLLHDKAA